MTDSLQDGGQPRIHSSKDQPLCPLCGTDLGIKATKEEPRTTLETLGAHFATACPATAHIGAGRPATAAPTTR